MVPAGRVSLVTLGVRDLAVARAFYEALGFVASSASQGDVVFFHGPGALLGLYPRALLAEDAHVGAEGGGFSGIVLATNLASEADVDAYVARAIAAGATPTKPAQKAFWGGYCAAFADPDGHLWEIAHNPFFPLDADGLPRLPA